MSDHSETYGRAAVRVASTTELLMLEKREGRSDRFDQIDALIEHVLRRSLSGERFVALERGREHDAVSILGLDAEQRAFVSREFDLAYQQAHGAWFLPEEAALNVGWPNLPLYFRDHTRFAMGIAAEERGRVRLDGSADALFVWTVLEPLFEHLFLPFALRGPLVGKKDRDWQRNTWKEAEAFFNALGFDVSKVLSPMRYGAGWSKLRAPQQLQAKQSLMQALMEQASQPHASRYRAYQVQRLLYRYYQQAKKGQPKLRQVLTKDLQRVLAGFFGGDWLDFLSYLGEEPHPDERIATALPETPLVVADRDRVTTVAAEHGLPVEEIERALAAFWGTGRHSSPVEERVEALRDFWREFDAIHVRQESGMCPLWGLTDDGGMSLSARPPYQPGLYRTLLSADLLVRIDRLWGTCMLMRWPGRIVSTISPHAAMAEAFGPAVKFWHGCALTAWFICEGPFSRTDLSGLGEYYQSDLLDLERLGCPIDSSLFDELLRAEARLGSPQAISDPEHSSRHEIGGGIHLTMEVTVGSRRAGFELLRDIISHYRHSWTERYLEAYLRSRWGSEIRDAARDFSLLHERKGRPPNLKQFAIHAVLATNHWFGGDISVLYRAIGEKIPMEPERCSIMPADREGFARSVLGQLVSQPGATSLSSMGTATRSEREREQVRWNLEWMAEESLSSVQREEALGRPPTLDEFGRERFAHRASVLAPEVDTAWTLYQQSIEAAKRTPGGRTSERQSDSVLPQPHSTEPAIVSMRNALPAVSTLGTERKPLWKRLLRLK